MAKTREVREEIKDEDPRLAENPLTALLRNQGEQF